jgi:peptidyl-prolyl cis-trans isomerase SurA
LFTIQGKNYTIGDFYAFVKAEQRPRTTGTAAHAMSLLYDAFTDKSLMDYEKANLEIKYPDYRMLVQEYHDGILLFQLMDEKVWSKAVEDTVGLQAFYAQNKDKYKWGPRAQAIVISAADKDLLQKAQQQLANRHYAVKSAKLTDILFASNTADLTKEATAKLNDLADLLKGNPELSMDVNGHVDTREAAGKATLSEERAAKVKAYLLGEGVAASQISTHALGKTKQAAADNTETGRRRNRRVSFTLYSSDLSALADNLNAGNPLAVQITENKFQKGESKALDQVNWAKGTYTTELNGRNYLIIIQDILEPGYKQLNEVRGVAISDYQNYLEQEWLKQLREKYPVEIKQDEVDKLIKK